MFSECLVILIVLQSAKIILALTVPWPLGFTLSSFFFCSFYFYSCSSLLPLFFGLDVNVPLGKVRLFYLFPQIQHFLHRIGISSSCVLVCLKSENSAGHCQFVIVHNGESRCWIDTRSCNQSNTTQHTRKWIARACWWYYAVQNFKPKANKNFTVSNSQENFRWNSMLMFAKRCRWKTVINLNHMHATMGSELMLRKQIRRL